MKFFDHGGVRLAYIDVPPTTEDIGQPILLIHGFASNHAVNWVHTHWVKTLTHAGRRVIALDNRGHGESGKLYDAALYSSAHMAGDAAALLDHLGVARADVMGYSMGARITAFLTLGRPDLVRSAILGGLGHRLIEGVGLPMGIADALEAPSLADVTDPLGRMFRAFAEQTRSDLAALAACIRGSRQTLKPAGAAQIACPVLVCVGTIDPIAGDPHQLARLFPKGEAFDIEGRDHNLAVGDKTYKQAVLAFLERRP
ncbi:MAG: alpha/beta fold hydrolase [Beijerinckiaceae bacterium]